MERFKPRAYRNIGDLVPVNELCTGHIPKPLRCLQTQPSYNPSLEVHSIDFQVAHQGMLHLFICSCLCLKICSSQILDSESVQHPIYQN